METKPKRRWYQFSLRTMLIVMVLSSAVFGYWVHWSKEWIRLRNEWRSGRTTDGSECLVTDKIKYDSQPTAPAGLWLLNEHGATEVYCEDRSDRDEASRVFPEAK